MWKSPWLPYSETFVLDQFEELSIYEPVPLSFHHVVDGIAGMPRFAPYKWSFIGKALRVIFGFAPHWRKLDRIFKDESIELIHAHFGIGGINCLRLAKRYNIPLVVTFHGKDAMRYGSKMAFVEAWYRRRLLKLFEKADILLPVSHYVADLLVAAGAPKSKIEPLYTGTKLKSSHCNVDERSGIITVSRLISIKGIEHILEAVARLPVDQRDTPLTIVGDGPERTSLECLAKELGVNASFTGRVSSELVPELLGHHQLFCGASLPGPGGGREGFGMVYLEAAQQGLPVVAYRSGGVAEAVVDGTTGILVEEGDIAALSAVMGRLLRDRKLNMRLGQEGMKRVGQDFDLSIQTSKLESIYDSVLQAR